MMTKFTNADVVVVGLIGERGREVKEFIDNILGPPAWRAQWSLPRRPTVRRSCACTAQRWPQPLPSIYRDQGKHVLLLMDSLTRFAQAQREVALPSANPGDQRLSAVGVRQDSATGGTRRQWRRGKGSITAFYTVLVEGDDQQTRSPTRRAPFSTGHIVLSRQLAEGGCIRPSISRRRSARDDDINRCKPPARGAPIQGAILAVPAEPRSDQRRRLHARFQSGTGSPSPRNPNSPNSATGLHQPVPLNDSKKALLGLYTAAPKSVG